MSTVTTTPLSYVRDVATITYDFPTVTTTTACDEIIKECGVNGLTERLKSIALAVAALAVGYLTYLAAATFVSMHGILIAGLTLTAAVTLFPVTLVAVLPPFIVAAKAFAHWDNANKYVVQQHKAELRKIEILNHKV